MKRLPLLFLSLALLISLAPGARAGEPEAAAPPMPAMEADQPDEGSPETMMHSREGGMGGRMGGMDFPSTRSCRTPEYYLRHSDALDLSDKQAEAMDRLSSSLKKQAITKGASVIVLEMELSDILKRPDFKLSGAEAKLAEIEKARYDLRLTVLKVSSEARDLLSPEQLEKLRRLPPPGGRVAVGPGRGGMRGNMPDDEMKRMMMERMQQKMP